MTIAEFDAAASRPRFYHCMPRAERQWARGVVRVAWLVALFARREFVSFQRYRARFGLSPRTFYRDLNVLRDAGMYLELHPTRGYRLVYFGPSIEAG